MSSSVFLCKSDVLPHSVMFSVIFHFFEVSHVSCGLARITPVSSDLCRNQPIVIFVIGDWGVMLAPLVRFDVFLSRCLCSIGLLHV